MKISNGGFFSTQVFFSNKDVGRVKRFELTNKLEGKRSMLNEVRCAFAAWHILYFCLYFSIFNFVHYLFRFRSERKTVSSDRFCSVNLNVRLHLKYVVKTSSFVNTADNSSPAHSDYDTLFFFSMIRS